MVKMSWNHLKTLCLTFLLSVAAVDIQANTNIVGNGGDILSCTLSSQNFLNGYYSLDYFLTLSNALRDDTSAEVRTWKESAERIHSLLKKSAPSLAGSFGEFEHSVFNNGDFTQQRIWEAAPFGLKDLKDEGLIGLIPENCKAENGTQIIQAVIRQLPSYSGSRNKIIYKYMPKFLEELGRRSPLQLSFLFVHEWLWDLSSNVDLNRRINKFLHSKYIDQMSGQQIREQLIGMGLDIPGPEFQVFSRSSCQGVRRKPADFKEQKNVFEKIGKLVLHKRRRLLWKDKLATEADWQLGKPVFYPEMARDYTAFSKTFSENDTELIHIFLDGKEANAGKNARGSLVCGFIDEKEFNLECRVFEDFNFGTEKVLSFKGLFTNQCLRLESYRLYTNDKGRYSLDLYIEEDNVLFVKF